MTEKKLIFRVHAIQRMFERKIDENDIRLILKEGEVIAEYADDKPFPSQLLLGFARNRPLHVVVARNRMDTEVIVITVYEPDLERWESDFKRRREK